MLAPPPWSNARNGILPAPSIGLLSMTQPVCAWASRARIVAMLGRNTVLTPEIKPRPRNSRRLVGRRVAAHAALVVTRCSNSLACLCLAPPFVVVTHGAHLVVDQLTVTAALDSAAAQVA